MPNGLKFCSVLCRKQDWIIRCFPFASPNQFEVDAGALNHVIVGRAGDVHAEVEYLLQPQGAVGELEGGNGAGILGALHLTFSATPFRLIHCS